MKTLGDILQLTNQFLKQKGNTSHRRVSEEILSHVLRLDRLSLYLQHDRPLDDQEITQTRDILKKVANGYPLEYVMGYVDFLGCRIEVDKRVLIPRPETELLTDLVIQDIKKNFPHEKNADVHVLDLCCGSGCIGLGIKKHIPFARILLTDLSGDAIDVAKQNAEKNELDVQIVQSDLTSIIYGSFDIVVCSPPYIAKSVYEKLDPSVLNWEPKMALCAGEKGTEIYERLAKEFPRILNEHAKIFLEIGYDQGNAIKEIFQDSSFDLTIKKDLAGHDRFVEIKYTRDG